MPSVLVVVESSDGIIKKVALEAVSYGNALAQKMSETCSVLVLGKSDAASTLGKNGADKVFVVNGEVSLSDNQSLCKLIGDQAHQEEANVIVLANNSTGRSLVGRLAARFNSGCATGVISLAENVDDLLTVERSVYAGKATAKISLSGKCKIISISSGVVPLKSDGIEVAVEMIEYAPLSKMKVIETKRITGEIPLPEADLVVSAGRGLKGPENWGIVEDLAAALGATTACSRPVADSGWRPHHEHVGQTGIAIKPKLYIALGISGAIQHLAGVNNSKVIVVINKDPEAPFFKAADYGIIGDVFEIVPRLTEAVKKIKAHQ